MRTASIVDGRNPVQQVAPQHVLEAANRLQSLVHRTPVITNRHLDTLAGMQLYFKCENLQKVGAFKFRGACNAISQMPASNPAASVVAHSSGNHAQAVAKAAAIFGFKAYLVMPSNSSTVKRQAVVDYGAEVIDCEPTLEARERTASEIQAKYGATLIHPFDDPAVIAGQGTAARELMQDVPDIDAMVAPVGGGGLISGTCLAVQLAARPPRVFAAEPAGADDAARSKAQRRLVPQTAPNTIADGLRTSLGRLTWPFVRDHVESVLTVADDQIVDAMKLFWQRTKLIIEPSAAVPLAAVLNGQLRDLGIRRLGIIVSGGNVDLDHLPW